MGLWPIYRGPNCINAIRAKELGPLAPINVHMFFFRVVDGPLAHIFKGLSALKLLA